MTSRRRKAGSAARRRLESVHHAIWEMYAVRAWGSEFTPAERRRYRELIVEEKRLLEELRTVVPSDQEMPVRGSAARDTPVTQAVENGREVARAGVRPFAQVRW